MNKTVIAILIALSSLLPLASVLAVEPADSQTVSMAPLLKSAQPSDTISSDSSGLALKTAATDLDLSNLVEGALVRDIASKKVYRFSRGHFTHIKTLTELRKFAGKPIIPVHLETIMSQLAA